MGNSESTSNVDARFTQGALMGVEVSDDRSPRGNTEHHTDFIVLFSFKGSKLTVSKHTVQYEDPSNGVDRWFNTEDAHVKEHFSYYYTTEDTVGDLLSSAQHRAVAQKVANRLAAFGRLRDGGKVPFPPTGGIMRRCVAPTSVWKNGFVMDFRITAVKEEGRLLEFRKESDYDIVTGTLRIDPLPSNKWVMDYREYEKDISNGNGKNSSSYKWPKHVTITGASADFTGDMPLHVDGSVALSGNASSLKRLFEPLVRKRTEIAVAQLNQWLANSESWLAERQGAAGKSAAQKPSTTQQAATTNTSATTTTSSAQPNRSATGSSTVVAAVVSNNPTPSANNSNNNNQNSNSSNNNKNSDDKVDIFHPQWRSPYWNRVIRTWKVDTHPTTMTQVWTEHGQMLPIFYGLAVPNQDGTTPVVCPTSNQLLGYTYHSGGWFPNIHVQTLFPYVKLVFDVKVFVTFTHGTKGRETKLSITAIFGSNSALKHVEALHISDGRYLGVYWVLNTPIELRSITLRETPYSNLVELKPHANYGKIANPVKYQNMVLAICHADRFESENYNEFMPTP